DDDDAGAGQQIAPELLVLVVDGAHDRDVVAGTPCILRELRADESRAPGEKNTHGRRQAIHAAPTGTSPGSVAAEASRTTIRCALARNRSNCASTLRRSSCARAALQPSACCMNVVTSMSAASPG